MPLAEKRKARSKTVLCQEIRFWRRVGDEKPCPLEDSPSLMLVQSVKSEQGRR